MKQTVLIGLITSNVFDDVLIAFYLCLFICKILSFAIGLPVVRVS